MSNLTQAAEKEMDYINRLIKAVTDSIDLAPSSSLKIDKRKGGLYYYERISGQDGKKIYLTPEDMPRVRILAQRDYNVKILKNLVARKLAIEKLEAMYPDKSLESIYEGLSPERKALVRPVILTDAQYTSLWLSAPYAAKSFDEDDESKFYTENGERVRSKSEVIIANCLFHAGIPYKYECPLALEERTIYPDFTILDVKNRRTFFLEHFGMMDNPEYAETFVNKLSLYQKNGYFPGERLIMTFETSKKPLDTRMVKQTVEQYFS